VRMPHGRNGRRARCTIVMAAGERAAPS